MFDKILKLTKQLYPKSRAYKIYDKSWWEKLHKALSVSEVKAIEDASAILFSILPDNDNFTSDDATDWERRLGLISNPSTPLEDRKSAILRKMNHPGTIKARQNYLYIQGQLQAAGFDVFVYENLAGVGPQDVLPFDNYGQHSDDIQMGDVQHGDAYSVYPDLFVVPQHGLIQHGDLNHNQYVWTNKVANNIPPSFDAYFDVGNSYRSSFFIGGNPLGTFANIPEIRRDEFRQLILKLKPVQSIGFLFINYT